jgi:hypothetical protein
MYCFCLGVIEVVISMKQEKRIGVYSDQKFTGRFSFDM